MTIRYKIYWVITLVLVTVGAVLTVKSPWYLMLEAVLMLQYEFVRWHVSVILVQYKMYRRKEIPDIQLSSVQKWLKKVFKIEMREHD